MTKVVKNGRLHQSVSRWCFGKLSLTELCQAATEMGLVGIDLLKEDEWPVAKAHGLLCTMGSVAGSGEIHKGLNDPANHAEIIAGFGEGIPKAKKAGVPNLVAFFGTRLPGMSDATAAENCVAGLNKIKTIAEDNEINICVELLNTKIDHKGYVGDRTAFGVEVVKAVNSPRIKLLYDVYHMQIMEGDIIRTIQDNHEHFAHYHTGGVPGRKDLDELQELQWQSVAKAILATNYEGFVAHEFIPRNGLESLRAAVALCDV